MGAGGVEKHRCCFVFEVLEMLLLARKKQSPA
jgi:hypothetical protein